MNEASNKQANKQVCAGLWSGDSTGNQAKGRGGEENSNRRHGGRAAQAKGGHGNRDEQGLRNCELTGVDVRQDMQGSQGNKNKERGI